MYKIKSVYLEKNAVTQRPAFLRGINHVFIKWKESALADSSLLLAICKTLSQVHSTFLKIFTSILSNKICILPLFSLR